MTLALFKDLCMDAVDALVLARFWQPVLGGTAVDHKDGSARIDPAPGRPDSERLWIDPVPEPRTGKTRVHLDVRLGAAEPSFPGATVLREPGPEPWWLLADPDGNEFCAFPPGAAGATDGGTAERPGAFQLVTDCLDAPALAAWWASVLGGEVRDEEYGPVLADAAGFPWERWYYQRVPEPKTVKNRVHWDVSLLAAVPDELVALGASVVRSPGGDITWWVLADPEGNEFCAFPPGED